MFIRVSIEAGLPSLLEAESLRTNPIIRSVAGLLALRDTGHVICDETVADLANALAEFGDRYGVDPQTIQYALQAAEPDLCEAREH